jgi:hypothetical protein
MAQDRVGDLLRSLGSGPGGAPLVERFSELCGSSLAVSGVGLSITSGTGRQSAVAATNELSSRIEELQVLLGEGPRIDAVAVGTAVLVDDLGADSAVERWPFFTPAARTGGVEAAFAFPLLIGAIRLGAMNLYRDRAGALTPEQLAQAHLFAAAAGRLMVDLQHGGEAGTLPDALAPGWSASSVVHQATGMIMVQLGIDVASAFAALRARAFGSGRPVQNVAADVVARRQRFDEGR